MDGKVIYKTLCSLLETINMIELEVNSLKFNIDELKKEIKKVM